MSIGFVKGAEATGKAIQKGGAKIRDRISPEETPSEVSPHVTKGLQVAKQATGGAVRVSQFLGKELQTIERTTNPGYNNSCQQYKIQSFRVLGHNDFSDDFLSVHVISLLY